MSAELQFGLPWFLWGVPLAPLMLAAAAALYLCRRRRMERFGERAALDRLAGDASPLRFFLRAIAFSAAVLFLAPAAARPTFGLKPLPVRRSGIDLIVALDVSKSMDAADVAPSRLRRALHGIDSLLENLGGDRIGLVAFAGEAVLVHPLTDRDAGFRITLDSIDTDSMPTPGTSLGAAIEAAREGFESRSAKHRVLVLITDGETHDEDALDQARLAHQEGVVIYALGIGSARGAPVPERLEDGRPTEFKMRGGSYVISRLNSNLLRRIAEAGGGEYYTFSGRGEALGRLYGRISSMGETEFASRFKSMRNEIYQYPLLAAVLLLGIEMAIGNRKWRAK